MSSVRPIQQLSNQQQGRAQSDLVQFGSPVPLAGYSSHLQQIAPFATPRGDQSSRNNQDEINAIKDQQGRILNSNQRLGYPENAQHYSNIIEQTQSYRNELPSSRSQAKELNGSETQQNYLSNSSLIGLLPSTSNKTITPPQSDIISGSNRKYYKGCHDINPSSYGTRNAYQTAPCSPHQNSRQQDQEQLLPHLHMVQHLDQQQGRVQEKQVPNEGDQYGVHFSLTTTQGHNNSLTGPARIPSLIVNEGMTTKQGLFDEQREITFKGLEDSKIISQKYQENVPNLNRNQASLNQQQSFGVQGQKQRMEKAGLETQQEEMMMVERYQSEQKQKVQRMEYYNQLQPSSEREDCMFPPLQQLDPRKTDRQFGDYKEKQAGSSTKKGDLENLYAHQLEVIQYQYQQEDNSQKEGGNYQNDYDNARALRQQQQQQQQVNTQQMNTRLIDNPNIPSFQNTQSNYSSPIPVVNPIQDVPKQTNVQYCNFKTSPNKNNNLNSLSSSEYPSPSHPLPLSALSNGLTLNNNHNNNNNNSTSDNTPKFSKQHNRSTNINNDNNNQMEGSFQEYRIHQQDNIQQPHSDFSQQILEDLIHQPANNKPVHSQTIHNKERNFSHLAEPLKNSNNNNSNSTKKIIQQGTTTTAFLDINKLDSMLHQQSPTYTSYLNQFDRNTGSTRAVLSHHRNKSAISPNTFRNTVNGNSNSILNSSFGNTSNIHHNNSKSNMLDDPVAPEQEGSLDKLNQIHQAVHNQLAQISSPLDPSYSTTSPAAPDYLILQHNNSDAPCSFGPSSQHPQKPQITPNQTSSSSQSSSTYLAPFDPPRRSPENPTIREYVNCSQVKDQDSNLSYIQDRVTESRQAILQNALQSIKPPCVDSNTKGAPLIHPMKIDQGMTLPAQALLQHYQEAKRNKGNSSVSLHASPSASNGLKLRSPQQIKAGIITQQTTPRTLKKWTEMMQQPHEQLLLNGYQQIDNSLSNYQSKRQEQEQKNKQEGTVHSRDISQPFNSIDDQIHQLNIGEISAVPAIGVQVDDDDHNQHYPHAPSFTNNSQYYNPNRDRLEMLLKKTPTSLVPTEKSQISQQLDVSYCSIHSNHNLRQNSFITKQQAPSGDISSGLKKIDSSFSKDQKQQTRNIRNTTNNNKINNNTDNNKNNNSSFIGQQQQSQQSSCITNGIIPSTSPRLREVYADLDDSRIQEKISSIKAQLSTMARHNAQLLQQDSQILGDYSLDKFRTTAGSVTAIIGGRSQSPFDKTHSITSRKQKEQLNTSNIHNSSKSHLNNTNKSFKNLSNASNTPASKISNITTTHQRALSALNDSLLVNTPPFSIALNANTSKDINPSNNKQASNSTSSILDVNSILVQGTSVQQAVVVSKPGTEMPEQYYQSQQLDKLKAVSGVAHTASSNTPNKNNKLNEQSYLVGAVYNGIQSQQSTVNNSPAGFDVVRFESKSDLGQSPPNSNILDKLNIQSNTGYNNQQQQKEQLQNPLGTTASTRQRAVSSISAVPGGIDHHIPVSSTISNSSKQSGKQPQRLGSPGQQPSPSGSAYFLSKRATNKTTVTAVGTPSKSSLGADTLTKKKDRSSSSLINNASIITAQVILDAATPKDKVPKTSVKTPRKEGYFVNPLGRTIQQINPHSNNLNKSNSSRSLTPTNRQKNSKPLNALAAHATVDHDSRNPSSATAIKDLSNTLENNQIIIDPIDKLNKGEPIAQQKMSEKELREYSKKKYDNLPDVKKMREQQQHQAQKISYHKQRSEKIKQFDEMCRAKNKPSSGASNV